MNKYPFAPGVIERPGPDRGSNRVEAIGFVLLVLACLGAVVAVVGFAAGYINLPGVLL